LVRVEVALRWVKSVHDLQEHHDLLGGREVSEGLVGVEVAKIEKDRAFAGMPNLIITIEIIVQSSLKKILLHLIFQHLLILRVS